MQHGLRRLDQDREPGLGAVLHRAVAVDEQRVLAGNRSGPQQGDPVVGADVLRGAPAGADPQLCLVPADAHRRRSRPALGADSHDVGVRAEPLDLLGQLVQRDGDGHLAMLDRYGPHREAPAETGMIGR